MLSALYVPDRACSVCYADIDDLEPWARECRECHASIAASRVAVASLSLQQHQPKCKRSSELRRAYKKRP